jgi:hypothetical protein
MHFKESTASLLNPRGGRNPCHLQQFEEDDSQRPSIGTLSNLLGRAVGHRAGSRFVPQNAINIEPCLRLTNGTPALAARAIVEQFDTGSSQRRFA